MATLSPGSRPPFVLRALPTGSSRAIVGMRPSSFSARSCSRPSMPGRIVVCVPGVTASGRCRAPAGGRR
eukprot:2880872-Alexandrium_andersonii.AAC.1